MIIYTLCGDNFNALPRLPLLVSSDDLQEPSGFYRQPTPGAPLPRLPHHRCRCPLFSSIFSAPFDTRSPGIGGLSCAYALASAGHRVRVLEALAQNARKSYSGLRVPPNMSKILTEWGLGEELKAKTRPCRQAAFDDRQLFFRFHHSSPRLPSTPPPSTPFAPVSCQVPRLKC